MSISGSKGLLAIVAIVPAALVLSLRTGPVISTDETLNLSVHSEPQIASVERIGLNLGKWTSWGAEQLSSNVLKNPGFEGIVDRAIVQVGDSGTGEFSDDADWLGRPDDFWKGAEYEVLSGHSVGTRGRIAKSLRHGDGGLPVFFTEGSPPPLDHGDAISLTKPNESEVPGQWWIRDQSVGRVAARMDCGAPGSPGKRCLALKTFPGQTTQVSSYLDAIADRAGKLLPVNGPWHLSFWARTAQNDGNLDVLFHRNGSTPFISKRVLLGREWRHVQLNFDGMDRGPAGTLELRFTATARSRAEEIWLDDVELIRESDGSSPFRQEVIAVLRRLRPAYLRDWQGQLGDTLENRLASQFARRSSRYRPGDATAGDFQYSLPDFLELCRSVNSKPWIVVPPTFTSSECSALGVYLGTQKGFPEVLVEFGNENWNPLFRFGGIPDPRSHGDASQRCFARIRQGVSFAMTLKTVVNAQEANPEAAERTVRYARQADLVALAPYYMHRLDTGLAVEDRNGALFRNSPGLAKLAHRLGSDRERLAVYEVNLHSTEGTASADERNATVSGAAAGASLAYRILSAMSLGVKRQCVYNLAEYDTFTADHKGFVKLWGVTSGLTTDSTLRTSGWALALLNEAIGDELHAVGTDGRQANIAAYAFLKANYWSAVVISREPVFHRLHVRFPQYGWAQPTRAVTLTENGPLERALNPGSDGLTIELPKWSMVALLPPDQTK